MFSGLRPLIRPLFLRKGFQDCKTRQDEMFPAVIIFFFVNRFGFSKPACFVGINGLVEPFLKVQLRLFC